ncbi:DUF1534 domain-containing protein, partial [Pseudomonas syringae]|nr:DUF1534 domain-containing protein [Pseudomonas syringae]NAO63950.1 DUF1534 domain-containing protein [Pseudomonas syringae]NAO68999.1 DUF1534 domain-containing protein [Pseudomonas syringae]NAO74141.1 DUF1534 domain-containing protein [Pseudomonas syringae]NAO79140.1 DUF1534 domain-containing protein [Pseudomonas syringae]
EPCGVQNAGRSGSVEIIVQPSGVIPLQRGNALRDAPRHRSAPHRIRSREYRAKNMYV